MNSFGQHLKKFLVENVRDYAMFVALIAIMIVFEVLSGGTFLSPDNINKLDKPDRISCSSIYWCDPSHSYKTHRPVHWFLVRISRSCGS